MAIFAAGTAKGEFFTIPPEILKGHQIHKSCYFSVNEI